MKNKQVVITIEQGVISTMNVPDGIEVHVIDLDVDSKQYGTQCTTCRKHGWKSIQGGHIHHTFLHHKGTI